MVECCVCIASAASLSAQALAFDAVSRTAITADPNWQGGDYYESGNIPAIGLSLARKIGHITYLSSDSMTSKFGREKSEKKQSGSVTNEESLRSNFEVGRYLDYQGDKFVDRFDANSYLHITRALDEYDLIERYGSLEQAFEKLQSKVLVVALTSDWLFPPEQSCQIANALLRSGKNVSYSMLTAPHGHDGFLVDIENLAGMIRAFLPWVGAKRNSTETSISEPSISSKLLDYKRIQKMIEPGSSLLDLGCGDGALLSYLRKNGQVRGMGVDIDLDNIIDVIYKGHDVFQNDVDGGLEMIPDDMYDYAVLSETLQVVKKPRLVLREMLRVAREGIVTFPNFGKWSHRLHLCLTGRMPKGKAIPHEWYDTPNIHPFTVSDFVDLCKAEGICIEELVCISSGFVDKILNRCGFCNAGSSRVLVRITTKERSKNVTKYGCF
jgi:homoserine O-acetyltransferase